jgi:4-diphosphocytidyl-2-C-methyl-D-erythritol kinase
VTLALAARAKVNLDLAVVGRRGDGLHELRTRMQSIDLHDLLEVERAEKTSLSVTGIEISRSGDNTVLAAQAALQEAAGRDLPAAFLLHKRIPPGSGFGGASSDAAAALRALVTLHCLDVDLREIAPRVGADVPFFLRGGAALIEGAGERATPIPAGPGWFALAWPGIELSTAAVYSAWDEVRGDGANQLRRAAGHVDRRVEEFAVALGPAWQMTGSGSAFFRVCANREEAEEAVAATANLKCWTAVSQAVGAWA